MADLSNLSISESFDHLLQISKSIMYDGTGSLITNLDIQGTVSASTFSGSHVGNFTGDGSGLTGVVAAGSGIFILTGSKYNTTQDLEITGSLTVTGPISASAFLGGHWTGSGDGTTMYDTNGGHTIVSAVEHSIIAGGQTNTINDNDRSGILAGQNNTIQGNASEAVICGGNGNDINACTYGFIGGGINNTLSSLANGSAIVGGNGNTIDTVDYSIILAGQNINATHDNTAYAQRLQVLEDTSLTGSLTVSGGIVDITGTSVISGSIFSGSFVGDGSGLTGIAGGIFVLTGSKQNTTNDIEITGSLAVSSLSMSIVPVASNDAAIILARDPDTGNIVHRPVSTISGSGGGGGSSRTSASISTSGSESNIVDSIDTLSNNAIHFIDVYVTGRQTASIDDYGYAKRSLAVEQSASVVTIRHENADMDKWSANLGPDYLNFAVNGSQIDIYVTGSATAKTIKWDSNYEIINKS